MLIIFLILLYTIQVIECASDSSTRTSIPVGTNKTEIPTEFNADQWKHPRIPFNNHAQEVKFLSVEFHTQKVIPLQRLLNIEGPIICSKAALDCQEGGIVIPKNDIDKTCHAIIFEKEDYQDLYFFSKMSCIYLDNKYFPNQKYIHCETFAESVRFLLPTFLGLVAFSTVSVYTIEKGVDYATCQIQSHYNNNFTHIFKNLIIGFIAQVPQIITFKYFSKYYKMKEQFCDLKAISCLKSQEAQKIINKNITFLENRSQKTGEVKTIEKVISFYGLSLNQTLKERIENFRQAKKLIENNQLNKKLDEQEEVLKKHYNSFLYNLFSGNLRKWLSRQLSVIRAKFFLWPVTGVIIS